MWGKKGRERRWGGAEEKEEGKGEEKEEGERVEEQVGADGIQEYRIGMETHRVELEEGKGRKSGRGGKHVGTVETEFRDTE